MRLRKRPSPLLLFLIPAFASIVVADAKDKGLARDRAVIQQDPIPTLPPTSPSKSKDDVGTKDAPVDGLDGKPHKGPFLVENADKKPVLDVEDIIPAKPKPSAIGPQKLIEEDGVMNDKNREKPKKGTTGTEGGVSEKDRDRKSKEDDTTEKSKNMPNPPKEAPPLPHSEQEKIDEKEKGKKPQDPTITSRLPGAVGLEKPTDLPDTPHDIPIPVPPSRPKDDDDDKHTSRPIKHKDDDDDADPEGIIHPFHSFILSLAMILFSEIGDKTFLVAALMAMRHPRLLVFSAAFSALFVMTLLSAILGHAVPTLLPRRFTSFAAAILFLVFGAKMLREGLKMSPDEGVGEEMKEVEMELEEKEHLARRNNRRRSSISPYVLESGRAGRRSRSMSRLPAPARSPSSSPSPAPNGTSLKGALAGLNNLFSLLLSPAWVQTFVMTFLGEWGDRSQIATIAMAAGADYWWVTAGAVVGHSVCTAAAVIGGRAIAGRVSMRVVTLGGAVAFLIFGVIYLLEAAYSD